MVTCHPALTLNYMEFWVSPLATDRNYDLELQDFISNWSNFYVLLPKFHSKKTKEIDNALAQKFKWEWQMCLVRILCIFTACSHSSCTVANLCSGWLNSIDTNVHERQTDGCQHFVTWSCHCFRVIYKPQNQGWSTSAFWYLTPLRTHTSRFHRLAVS